MTYQSSEDEHRGGGGTQGPGQASAAGSLELHTAVCPPGRQGQRAQLCAGELAPTKEEGTRTVNMN